MWQRWAALLVQVGASRWLASVDSVESARQALLASVMTVISACTGSEPLHQLVLPLLLPSWSDLVNLSD
jgi:hypothetical protein